jgi:mRNA-degrading endonuclease RelE of RelBE toxin-antitoxin system
VPADHAWHLRFTRAVFHDVQRWGLSNADFIPTLAELLAMIEIDPHQFPEKRGSLSGARAAALTYRGRTWRAVYDVDDYAREILVLAIGEHDNAYDDAARRRFR